MPSRRLRDRALRRKAAVALSANKQSESRYVRQLRGIMAAVHKATLNQIGDTVPTAYELALITAKIQAALPTAVNAAFTKMSHDVVLHNAKALQTMGVPVGPQVRQQRLVRGRRGDAIGATLAKQLGDPGLATAIDAARQANIALITNAARDYAADVQKVFNDPKNIGLHVKDLTDKLVERGNVSQSRAELIARDQTLKLNGNITQIRQQAAGITSYTWSTSNDERVREEHRALEGQVFTWGNPPSVGAPGEDFQCRCIAVPIIEGLEEIFGDPVAPVEEAPVEEDTFVPPEADDFEPAPPPPLPPPVVLPPVVVAAPPPVPKPVPPPVVVEPKAPPPKPVKEPKPPKPPKVTKEPKPAALPPSPTVVELPVEAPVAEEPPRQLTWGERPSPKQFTRGTHLRQDVEAPGYTPAEVDKLTALLVPDQGHEYFLSQYPLEKIKIWDKVDEGANGIYRTSQGQLEVRGKSFQWTYDPKPFELGKGWVSSDSADTVEEARENAFIHEFGHHIHLTDRKNRSPEFRKVDEIISNAFDSHQSAVTQYAETMKEEYFAETYFAWRKFPDLLLDHDPVGHAMVEQVMKIRGIR